MGLWEFLADLAARSDKLNDFNSSQERARALMNEAKLGTEEQAALLSRNPGQVHAVLAKEGHGDKAFTMPAGPVISPVGIIVRRFKVEPQK